MSDPVTWAAIGAAAAAAVGGVATYSAGQAAKKTGEFNARLAEREAEITQAGAQIEEERHRDNLRRFIASQRAAGGASGLALAGGPAGLLVEEAAAEGERDALLIRYSGDVAEARALAEAAASRFEGRAAARSASLGAVSQVLKGGGRAASIYAGGAGGKTTTGA